jgi:drug/metabolite transporter (DMT)-like permease
MTDTLEAPPQQTDSLSTLILLILLLIGVFTLSLAAIFIKFSEHYIGPNATVFNRFWIATVILGLWRGVKAMSSRLSGDSPAQKQNYTIHDILLLLVSATVTSISHIAWAWSLTQTKALLSAVFYASNFLVMEKLRDKFSATSLLLWSCFFRIFLTFPVALLT